MKRRLPRATPSFLRAAIGPALGALLASGTVLGMLVACSSSSDDAPDFIDTSKEDSGTSTEEEGAEGEEGVDDERPAPPAPDDRSPDEVEGPDTEEPGSPPTPAPGELKPGCTAKASLAGVPAWVFFTRPDKPCTGTAGSGIDSHILNELTRLIDSVPAGGRIDGHIFSISVDSVAEALVNAQTRGVEVWISGDGAISASTDPAKTVHLEKLKNKVYCTSAGRNGCIATATDSISHTKLFAFSTATAPDGTVAKDVVWFGSANQTYASGMKLYNNNVTIFGDGPLYTKFRGYLDDLYKRKPYADYYDPAPGGTERGHFLAASADVYVSPELSTDLVVNRLDDLTPDAKCEVRVIQTSIRDSRLAVVDQLIAMKKGGCKISVIAATYEPAAKAKLAAAGIPLRTKPIHDKSFIVYGKFGAAYEYRVYTGSQNLSGSAAHKYDEIFVKLAAEKDAVHPLYDAYIEHFKDAYDDAAPAP